MVAQAKAAFQLGRIVATPAMLRAAQREVDMLPPEQRDAEALLKDLILRHATLDAGNLDPEDQQANLQALKDGSRILSSFILPRTQEKVWLITEAEGEGGLRASTCLLLPYEY